MAKKNERVGLTIDEVIGRLRKIKERSPLKGDTCVFICIQEQEYQPIHDLTLSSHEESTPENPSGVVLLFSDTLDAIITNGLEDGS